MRLSKMHRHPGRPLLWRRSPNPSTHTNSPAPPSYRPGRPNSRAIRIGFHIGLNLSASSFSVTLASVLPFVVTVISNFEFASTTAGFPSKISLMDLPAHHTGTSHHRYQFDHSHAFENIRRSDSANPSVSASLPQPLSSLASTTSPPSPSLPSRKSPILPITPRYATSCLSSSTSYSPISS